MLVCTIYILIGMSFFTTIIELVRFQYLSDFHISFFLPKRFHKMNKIIPTEGNMLKAGDECKNYEHRFRQLNVGWLDGWLFILSKNCWVINVHEITFKREKVAWIKIVFQLRLSWSLRTPSGSWRSTPRGTGLSWTWMCRFWEQLGETSFSAIVFITFQGNADELKRLLEKARKNQQGLEAFGDMNIDKFEWVSIRQPTKKFPTKALYVTKAIIQYTFFLNSTLADGWRQEGEDSHNHILRNFPVIILRLVVDLTILPFSPLSCWMLS